MAGRVDLSGLLAMLAVLLLALGAVWPLWKQATGAWVASSAAATEPMRSFEIEPRWLLDGQPRFSTVEVARSPDGRSVTGIWVCDGPGKFEWHFDRDEVVWVLEGRVDVQYRGQNFTLGPGQRAVFKAGTTAVWHVPQYLRKVFTLNDPGPLLRAWTRWVSDEPGR
jgi:uncharacterized cupin superfamily protein